MRPLIGMLLCCLSVQAGDTITIKHRYYTTTFDTVKGYPVLVQWWATKKMLDCNEHLNRQEKFTKDPKLSSRTDLNDDYKGSGYDRGHNMPAYDNGCNDSGMTECFYYSNAAPQTPRLNRGDWKQLEDYTRDSVLALDSVKVWCGSVGAVKKIGRVTVPRTCWKVLYIKKRKRYEAYVFSNDTTSLSSLQGHRTTTSALYKLTGIKVK